MSQAVDPLRVLCDCARQGAAIQILPDGIRLGALTFGRDTLVGILQIDEVKPYTLLVVVYAYLHRDKAVADYIRESMESKIERIHTTHRRSILSYLEDPSLPLSNLVAPILTVPQKLSQGDELIAKKARIEDERISTETHKDQDKARDLAMLLSLERTHKNCTTILMANKTLDRISAIIDQVEKHDVRQSSGPEKGQGNPIIIVPAGLSSNITLWNVKDFLQDGVYMTIQEVKKIRPNKPDQPVLVQYTRSGKNIMFHVYDNPQKITENLKNVVAIFTTGKEWELEPFKAKNPANIFCAHRGFHLALDQDKPEGSVPQWNVKVIRVGRNTTKRYLDAQARTEFWADLESFMSSKCPQFLR